MKIYKPIEFNNIEYPIIIIKPLLDKNGINIKNLYISDRGDLYNRDQMDKTEYYKDCPKSSVNVRYDENGRSISSVGENGKTCPLSRSILISFENAKRGSEFYDTHQADHINPSIPVDNSIYNLRWTTQQENMKNAGETGVMIKKYRKPLVNQICQMICEGYSRMEIKTELKINGQLIDDIRAGRSHKSVSSKYLDKGFEYSKYDKEARDKESHEICKLIDLGWRTCDIVRKLNLKNQCMVSDIKFGRKCRDISSQYNFLKS